MRKTRLSAVVATVALLATGVNAGVPAWAADRDDLVDKQEENNERIEQLQSSLEGVDVDLQKAYLNLEKTRNQIPGAEVALAQANDALAAAQREAEANAALLDAAQTELSAIETEIAESGTAADSTQSQLAEIARATYRGETMPSALDMVVGATSAQDFAEAYRANITLTRTQTAALRELEQSAAAGKNRQARQVAVEEKITELKAEADALVETRAVAQESAQAKKNELIALEQSIDDQSAKLEKQKKAYQTSLDEVEQEQKETAAQIRAIDEENRRQEALRKERERKQRAAAAKAQSSNSGGSSSGGSSGSSGSSSARPNYGGGIFIHPISSPLHVNSPWGYRNHPFGGYRMHQGVDLRSQCGEPQYATAAGTISYTIPASAGSTGGNIVRINHGIINGRSYQTSHMHLTSYIVSEGQRVSQGQVIGYTGQTGRVTGCHVHYEIWIDGVSTNPMLQPGF